MKFVARITGLAMGIIGVILIEAGVKFTDWGMK